MAIVYEQYEWICEQDLEEALENNSSKTEDKDDSERRSRES